MAAGGHQLSLKLVVLALASAMLLGACSGDALNSPAALQASSGNAFTTGTTADTPKFNPFADASAAASAGRQVIANPTVADIMLPASDLPEIAMGRADATVTIVQYESLTCPYCRKFLLEEFPTLKREYIDTGKVRFILREFPIGLQSGTATIAMRCAPADKQFVLYEMFMTQQAAWVSQEVRRDPIFKIASQVGMNRADFDACYENRSMIANLNKIKERGRTLGIVGTPNFFVNGKLVKGTLDMAKIRAMIDPVITAKAL